MIARPTHLRLHQFQFLIAILFLLFISGCNSSRKNPAEPKPEQTEFSGSITFGDTVAIPEAGVSLVFNRLIADSRLPIGTPLDMFSYHTARIEFLLLPDQKYVYLTISGDMGDTATVRYYGESVTLENFRIRLTNLQPQPEVFGQLPDSPLVADYFLEKIDSIPSTKTNFLPLTNGNRWVYLDSSFQNGAFVAEEVRTITVVKNFYDAVGHWWALNNELYGIYPNLLVNNDTVYSRQSGGEIFVPGTTTYYKTEELAPTADSTDSFAQRVEGDVMVMRYVYAIDSTITTQAGTFSIPYRYSGAYPYQSAEYLFSPGTGIIYAELYDRYTSTNHRIRLVDVELH